MVVVDSSAIIPLIKIGRLDLIRKLFKNIIIPSVVWVEVVEEGKKRGEPVSEFEKGKDVWFKVEECKDKEADLAVLELAKEKKDTLLTNDAAVYYTGLSLNIKVWWLTTLLLACVKNKKISKEEGEDILLKLVSTAGMHLKSDILSELLMIIKNL